MYLDTVITVLKVNSLMLYNSGWKELMLVKCVTVMITLRFEYTWKLLHNFCYCALQIMYSLSGHEVINLSSTVVN